MGVQSIDHELRTVCEELISQCAELVCQHLSPWVHNNQEQTASLETAEHVSTLPAPKAAVGLAEAYHNFALACERDLRSSVLHLRLYLGDSETLLVLLTHIRERIVGCYSLFRQVAVEKHGEELNVLQGLTALRSKLGDICANT
jgi:hypothetical protein